MDGNDIIAATCLLLSCTTQVAVLTSQKRRHSTWIRNYLCCHHQESVYYSLLPDLAELHREKFHQFFAHGIWDIWGVVSTHWTSNW